MKPVYLTLTPHDPIIARDGRPFGAGQGIRMKSLDWPYPSVLAGSLRTLMGKISSSDFDVKTIEALKRIHVYGPLPLFEGIIYLPAPKDILVRDEDEKRECFAIRPIALNKGEGCNLPDGGLLPAMLPESVDQGFKPAMMPAFWSIDKMAEWLANATGDSFSPPPDPEIVSLGDGFINQPERDPRIHIKIDPKLGSSDEGMLFETVGLDMSLKGNVDGIRIAARIEADDEWSDQAAKIDCLHTIGGERRLARWKTDGMPEAWDCPEALGKALEGKKRIRLVLATPAIFSQGWLPGWLHEVEGSLQGFPPDAPEGLNLRLVSACIDRWKPISGWSLESKNKGNRPKPVRRLVTAGSVYFFEVISGNAEKLAQKLWMKPVSDVAQDRQDGFGLALWGVWDDAGVKKTNGQREEV